MWVNPFPPDLPFSPTELLPQVYSMNLELVGRVAPVQLTVSPQLLSPLANFAHSSKVGLVSPSAFGAVVARITNAPQRTRIHTHT